MPGRARMKGVDGAAGLALALDAEGRVAEILRDDFGRLGAGDLRRHLPSLMDGASVGPALDFLLEIAESGAAFDRELALRGAAEPLRLHFAGGRLGDRTFVAGSTTKLGILELFKDLSSINAEQSDEIRRLRGSPAARAGAAALLGSIEPGASAAPGGLSAMPPPAAPPRAGPAAARTASGDETFLDELSRLNNELVSAQRALEKGNAELQRLDALKNRFLGMAAHDLRSPLSALLMGAELFAGPQRGIAPAGEGSGGPALPKEIADFLETVREYSGFMLGLVEDLLDEAALAEGRLRVQAAPCDLGPILARARDMHARQAARKGVRLELAAAAPGAALPLFADANRLGQVLNNLIGNAVKFTEPGKGVSLRAWREGATIRAEVADEGRGLEPAQLARVMEPFGATSLRGTAGEKGTGLGLSIARRLLEAMGGSLSFESEPGKGTRALISLPAAT